MFGGDVRTAFPVGILAASRILYNAAVCVLAPLKNLVAMWTRKRNITHRASPLVNWLTCLTVRAWDSFIFRLASLLDRADFVRMRIGNFGEGLTSHPHGQAMVRRNGRIAKPKPSPVRNCRPSRASMFRRSGPALNRVDACAQDGPRSGFRCPLGRYQGRVNVAGAGESGVRPRTGSHGECDQAEGICDHAACAFSASMASSASEIFWTVTG